MNGGSSMAQHSSGTAGEHRRHPPCLTAAPSVSDGINTTVDAMQAPLLGALGDRTLRQSHLDELARRHDPMLHPRYTSDSPIHRVALVNHEDTKAPRPLNSPPRPWFRSMEVRWNKSM